MALLIGDYLSSWLTLCLLVILASNIVKGGISAPSTAFIFGDSLADVGNNNHIRTIAKANFLPYGINFPNHLATGRFSDGFNAFDYFTMKLGLPLVPAYANRSIQGAKLLQGVNFASGASGIMGYTGIEFGKVFSLDMQLEQFQQVKEEIVGMIGEDATMELLSKALVLIVSGSNDWLNTYLIRGSPLPKIYPIPQFRDVLLAKYLSQIKDLYDIGLRRINVVGLGALGCCPSQLRAYKSENGTCVGFLNDIVVDFNDHLRSQLFDLAASLPNVRFGFLSIFTPIMEAINNPSSFGLTITHQACCGIGKYGGFFDCLRGFPVCKDVSNHLFWDAYHPTSKFSKELVEILWNNGPPYTYPKSGKELSNL